jgi:hypothetical protein
MFYLFARQRGANSVHDALGIDLNHLVGEDSCLL